MGEADRYAIVGALLAEMKAKLLNATPETRAHDDAAVLLLSGVLRTFTAEPSLPAILP